MISRQDIDKIMDAVRIEDVVEQFVPLKRRGANYVGCCPFHDEKTPSFVVNPARGIFKCFGCGKAGNAVAFLMEYNHYTYPEALRWLAHRYGVEIHEKEETEEERQQRDERDELYSINEFAQKYFYSNLLNTDEGKAIGLSYFMEREVTQKTIDTWGLGYCMRKSDDFSKHALKNGYSEELLIKSGLSLKSERTGELYDRFHSRVTFPIYNVAGRVLGFSARILTSDKNVAKYVNSPETAIYTKGKVLFGLFFAKNEIAKQDVCYLVEGNVDAVMMHQNEVKNVVATSGTALTEDQVRLIKRYTKNVVIMYDGDKAGIKATIKATDLFLKEGMHVKTILFPDDDDPDSYSRKHTQEEFHSFLKENAQNFIIYRTNLVRDQIKNDPIQKSQLIKEIVHSISLMPDLIERNLYIQQCSSIFDMSEQVLTEELSHQIRKNTYENNKRQQSRQEQETPAVETPEANEEQPLDVLAPTHAAPVNPDAEQERALIKALLSYFDKNTTQLVVNEDNKTELKKMNAAEYIITEMLADNIQFNDSVCQEIFSIYCNTFINTGEMPRLDELTQHENKEIVSFVCDALVSPYKTSSRWGDKYNVYIPGPESQVSIDKDVKETVLLLKYHKIEAQIKQMETQLKQTADEEQATKLLYSIAMARQVKMNIAQELRIIAN